jgi:hypothetical protein
MSSEPRRRFSLDSVEIDPTIRNRIHSADGDHVVGQWDGEHIEELIKELERIEETDDPNYAGLPHAANIPDDLRNQAEKDYPIWTCDKNGRCLAGAKADQILTPDQIRDHYQTKFGGVEHFKEHLRRERELLMENLRQKKP